MNTSSQSFFGRLVPLLGYALSLALVVLGVYLLLMPGGGHEPHSAGTGPGMAQRVTYGAGDSGAFGPEVAPSVRAIDSIRVGDRVAGRNPQVSDDERLAFETIRPSSWRQVDLVLPKEDDTVLQITLLRPTYWFGAHGISSEPGEYPVVLITEDEDSDEVIGAIGLTVALDMPELGAVGDAFVLRVSSCPPLKSGTGQVVTGTFAHQASEVLDLTISVEEMPLGVTPSHPFWSADRQDFVEVGALRIGENLQTLDGLAQVVSIVPRAGPQTVYNVEVHGEHVYHVASSGVLVHNSCTPNKGPVWTATKNKSGVENAFGHFKKHGSEFPEYLNATQYVRAAKNFVMSPPQGALTKVRPNGDKLFYDPATNTFVIKRSDGALRTMFRPTDGIAYWLKQ